MARLGSIHTELDADISRVILPSLSLSYPQDNRRLSEASVGEPKIQAAGSVQSPTIHPTAPREEGRGVGMEVSAHEWIEPLTSERITLQYLDLLG